MVDSKPPGNEQEKSDIYPEGANAFTLQALAHHKMQGMRIAFRARLIALAVIVVMLPIVIQDISVLYYMAFAVLFVLIGWAQQRAATVERSRLEVVLLTLDLVLMAFIVLVPNPFADLNQPLEMQFRFGGHTFFFVYLALGTLAYSSRTIRLYAILATIIWALGTLGIWFFSAEHPSSQIFREAMDPYWVIWAHELDPSALRLDMRFQEIVVFAIVAYVLSLTVKRFSDLILEHAAVARERTNLARYFSPNMVDNLSHNDDPLKQIKTQNVAVLFVDIIGFTNYSNSSNPQEVIETLREFHKMMEECVFDNSGTLDKFLGDGLMATFGTPEEGTQDALNALRCANAMVEVVEYWNGQRRSTDKQEIRIGLGLHYGPCVLGDIGGENRLEFAVIGDTVNIASRVEAKTRELGVSIAMTQAIADKVQEQANGDTAALEPFKKYEHQEIRGLDNSLTLFGATPQPIH